MGLLKGIGPLELIIILVVVLLLLGPGRLVKVGRDLGQGIREFRHGLAGDEKKEEEGEGAASQEAADEAAE